MVFEFPWVNCLFFYHWTSCYCPTAASHTLPGSTEFCLLSGLTLVCRSAELCFLTLANDIWRVMNGRSCNWSESKTHWTEGNKFFKIQDKCKDGHILWCPLHLSGVYGWGSLLGGLRPLPTLGRAVPPQLVLPVHAAVHLLHSSVGLHLKVLFRKSSDILLFCLICRLTSVAVVIPMVSLSSYGGAWVRGVQSVYKLVLSSLILTGIFYLNIVNWE